MICGDDIKENAMGVMCSTHWRREEFQQNLMGKGRL